MTSYVQVRGTSYEYENAQYATLRTYRYMQFSHLTSKQNTFRSSPTFECLMLRILDDAFHDDNDDDCFSIGIEDRPLFLQRKIFIISLLSDILCTRSS